MSYYQKFEEVIEQVKQEENIAAILFIGKTAKATNRMFDHLNDIDLLIVYENNRPFERQVEIIDGVPFDISYISIFDLITQVEGRNKIWVNMIMGAQVYEAKNELVFGIIDRVKDIYLNGTVKPKDEDIRFIRFTLSQKLQDVKNRMQDVILSSYLMQRLFNQAIEDYYTLRAMWVPNAKNMIDNLAVVDETLCNLSKQFIYECTAKGQLEILETIVKHVLEPYGGFLTQWPKGHYNIAK